MTTATLTRPGVGTDQPAALIYARVSTEEQGRGYSLPTQIEGAERRAVERGYRIAGIFTDEHTGTEVDRPGIAALYDALVSTGAKIVLCHDTDRLGRGWPRALIEREMEAYGAQVEYILADYSGDAGELQKDIRAAIDAFDLRQRTERSRRGKNGKARAGSVIPPAGTAPFGYRYVPSPHGGQFVIDDERAEIVRQVYHWLTVNHLSSWEIAKRLHAAGVLSQGDVTPAVHKRIKTRTDWWPASVRKLITNTVYKGVWHWGKTRIVKRNGHNVKVAQPPDQWIAVAVPGIVDAETWERAQVCLAENKQLARRNTKRAYLLQGRVFCTCGRHWIGHASGRGGTAYYRCSTSPSDPWRKACPTRFGCRQEALDRAVWGYVIGELLNPDNLTAEIDRQRQAAAAQTKQQAARLRAVGAELREVDRKLEILVGQALDGMPQAILDVHKRDLLGQRHDLEDQRARTAAESASVGITDATVETLQQLAATVQEAEPRLTPEERRQMLAILRVRVDVIDAKHARVSGLITDAILDLQCT